MIEQPQLQKKVEAYKVLYNSLIEKGEDVFNSDELDALATEANKQIKVKHLMHEVKKYFKDRNINVGFESYKISEQPCYIDDFSNQTANMVNRVDGILMHIDGRTFTVCKVESVQPKTKHKIDLAELQEGKVCLINALNCTNSDNGKLVKRRQFAQFEDLYLAVYQALRLTSIEAKTDEIKKNYKALAGLEGEKSLIKARIEKNSNELSQMQKATEIVC